MLVFLGGAAKLDGRVSPGASWRFQFGGKVASSFVQEWTVWSNGAVTFRANVWVGSRLEKSEIGSRLDLDSPEIARLALRYGGQRFIDRYPNASLGMSYRSLSGVVFCEVKFFDYGPPRAPCELGPIVIDADNGQLLTRELSCLELIP